MQSNLWERVGEVLREAASRIVMPHFSALAPEDMMFKTPNEPVTVADRLAEEMISRTLSGLMPGASVVGEEACSSDPELLQRLEEGVAWLVDPIDGTANYMAGREPFAMMVALLRQGEIVGSCILDPVADRLCVAELGGGAWLDGRRLSNGNDPLGASDLRGIVSEAFLPPEQRGLTHRIGAAVAEVIPTARCAGHEYPLVATGQRDFALYWRTLPWDHAPGTILLREAGGSVTHLDGSLYRPVRPRSGLLLARTPAIAHEILNIVARSGE